MLSSPQLLVRQHCRLTICFFSLANSESVSEANPKNNKMTDRLVYSSFCLLSTFLTFIQLKHNCYGTELRAKIVQLRQQGSNAV